MLIPLIIILLIALFYYIYKIRDSINEGDFEGTDHAYIDESAHNNSHENNKPVEPSFMSWNDYIVQTDVDPSVHKSHAEFINETSVWSSGSNFTSVSDDNINSAFTNFQGINRPSHVPIGASARQVPDIDESVLMRNDVIRWNGVRFS